MGIRQIAFQSPPAGPAPREPHGPGIRERGPGGPLFSASVGRPGAVHRSAAPRSPTGSPRSTIGARGLSFRVRNGSGRATPALAADRWAAPAGPGGPRALRAAQRKEPFVGHGSGSSSRGASPPAPSAAPGTAHERPVGVRGGRARAISTARLRASRPLHLRPVDGVFYPGPYRKEN